MVEVPIPLEVFRSLVRMQSEAALALAQAAGLALPAGSAFLSQAVKAREEVDGD